MSLYRTTTSSEARKRLRVLLGEMHLLFPTAFAAKQDTVRPGGRAAALVQETVNAGTLGLGVGADWERRACHRRNLQNGIAGRFAVRVSLSGDTSWALSAAGSSEIKRSAPLMEVASSKTVPRDRFANCMYRRAVLSVLVQFSASHWLHGHGPPAALLRTVAW